MSGSGLWPNLSGLSDRDQFFPFFQLCGKMIKEKIQWQTRVFSIAIRND